ncbi:hypothetical protein BC628DRAFT_1420854 [Trametes gibbosa]|nr:hypothetical protein BC628DRAFT_1420854 [Trametes gibbosa]
MSISAVENDCHLLPSAVGTCENIGQPRPFGSLNTDVLSHIISFIDYTDALSFSYTCKYTYTISLDPALHTVVLGGSSTQVMKFRDFLVAKESRPLFLKSLEITKPVTLDVDSSNAKELAKALSDILEKAKLVQRFSCGAMLQLIIADRNLRKNLIALPRLTDLKLLDGGRKSAKIAALTLSPDIQRLTLDMPWFGNVSRFEGFLAKLVRHRHLTHISLSRMGRDFYFSHTQSAVPHFCIPSVRMLTLTTTYIPLAFAATIFPNATHIAFSDARHFPNVGTFDVPPEDVTTSWPILEEAHIEVRDLAVWPIASIVRRLDLDLLRGTHSSEAISAVERMHPRVLACAYTVDRDNIFWARLPIIATELHLLDLRLLELCCGPRDHVLSHLAGFPTLTAVFICIRAYGLPADPVTEVAALARQLGEQNSALRFVGLSIIDGRSVRENEPVFDEERLGSTWFELRRNWDSGYQDVEDVDVLKVRQIPTAAGLKVRDYLYEANFDRVDWEEQLSMFS